LRKGISPQWAFRVAALFVHREGMFQALNFDVGVYDPANQVCVKAMSPVFGCGLRVDSKSELDQLRRDAIRHRRVPITMGRRRVVDC